MQSNGDSGKLEGHECNGNIVSGHWEPCEDCGEIIEVKEGEVIVRCQPCWNKQK